MSGPSTTLHEHLRAWRHVAKFTLEQLAERIGSKPNTISGWETGGRTVDLDDLKKIADAYGVHPAALLFAPPGDKLFIDMKEASAILARMPPEAIAEWLAIGRRIAPDEENKES
jgi:transcriptional regulator with XRE-family HTH domain